MKLFIRLSIFALILLTGCQGNNNQAESLSTTKYGVATRLYYEEYDDYKAAFYSKGQLDNNAVNKWIQSCEKSDVYYKYIYEDPESCYIYIYYSNDDTIYDSLKFSIEDSIIKLYVTTDDEANEADKTDGFIIRIQTPSRGSRITETELFIDDVPIDMNNLVTEAIACG